MRQTAFREKRAGNVDAGASRLHLRWPRASSSERCRFGAQARPLTTWSFSMWYSYDIRNNLNIYYSICYACIHMQFERLI